MLLIMFNLCYELSSNVARLLEIQLVDNEVPFELIEEMNLAIDEAKEQIKRGDYLENDKP